MRGSASWIEEKSRDFELLWARVWRLAEGEKKEDRERDGGLGLRVWEEEE